MTDESPTLAVSVEKKKKKKREYLERKFLNRVKCCRKVKENKIFLI